MGNCFSVHGELLRGSCGSDFQSVSEQRFAFLGRRASDLVCEQITGAADGDGASFAGAAQSQVMPPLARSSALPKPVRGLATQPRATLWAKWATNWYALQERRSTLNAVQSRHGPRCGVPLERGALANPGRCPRLGCAAPTGRRRRHGRGQWRWEKIKPLASNAFLLSNLGQSYPKTGS